MPRKALNPPMTRPHDMREYLKFEEDCKPLVHLLFVPDQLDDISALLSERKSGTDFIATPFGKVPATHGVRGENKFERYTTGRVTLEFLSVDRAGPNGELIIPGWFFTSRAAWLLSWFPCGDLLVCNMDELREVELARGAGPAGTSAYNEGYLSWCRLPNINVLMDRLKHARWLDFAYETGYVPEKQFSMVHRRHAGRKLNGAELMTFMSQFPRESTPVPVSQEELRRHAREIAKVDLKAEANARMRNRLTWLNEPVAPTPAPVPVQMAACA